MITMTHLVGWLLVGAAAGLAGMVWPFRRGIVAIGINLVAGMLGALLAPLLAIAGAGVSPRAPICLGLAALGALVLLLGVHGLWLATARRTQRHAAHPRTR